MQDISRILVDVRDVGENILSTGKDIQLLLREAKEQQRIHSRDLVENILSLCAYLSGLSIKDLDRWEELADEVRKIEFSCVSLRSALKEEVEFQSKIKEVFDILRVLEVSSNRIITLSFVSKLISSKSYNGEDVCYSNKRFCEQACDGECYEDGLSSVKNSEPNVEGTHDLSSTLNENLGNDEVCYKDKLSCEKDCNGDCYKDNLMTLDDSSSSAQDSNRKESLLHTNIDAEEVCYNGNDNLPRDGISGQGDKNCPECIENFTESPFTHVETGVYEDIEISQQAEGSAYNSSKKIMNMSEISDEDLDLGAAIRANFLKFNAFLEENDLANNKNDNNRDLKDMQTLDFREPLLDTDVNHLQQELTYATTNNGSGENGDDTTVSHDTNSGKEITDSDCKGDSLINEETERSVDDKVENGESTTSVNDIETEETEQYTTCATVAPKPTTYSYSYYSEETTTSGYESTTETSYYSYTTEDSTTVGYDTTTDSYTTEEPTTPVYETTTQDLYKLSQDVYSMANDLSSKANEISSLSSDISSKVSSMGSMVSDLNTYDNDELTKTINSVNKLTQEISSKTSEMSSGCSSMSSLASDISSASSDLSTSERRHPIKTTPWQKINSKGQDLVTAAQVVVSGAQEVLSRVGGVVELAKGLRVANAVEAAGYEVTSKAQLVISETLGIASAVLELMTSLES